MDTIIQINDVCAKEILDPAGRPGIEVRVLAGEYGLGSCSVFCPVKEALHSLPGRQKTERETGRMTAGFAEEVNGYLALDLIGENVFDQSGIDRLLCRFFRQEKRAVIAGRIRFCISAAVAKAGASLLRIPLYRYLGGVQIAGLPLPVVSVVRYRGIDADCRELTEKEPQVILAVPSEEYDCRQGIELCTDIYHEAQRIPERSGRQLQNAAEVREHFGKPDGKCALQIAACAAERCGIRPDRDIYFLDDVRSGRDCAIETAAFPGVAEKGKQCAIAVLPLTETGTMTELAMKIRALKKEGKPVLIDGELYGTPDPAAADVAVGFSADLFHAGFPIHSENTGKYNRLLEIEEEMAAAYG